MSIIEAIVLGLIQGATEFIPVSSSGHLIIAHQIFGSVEDSLAFDVALHVGTVAALLVFFRKDLHGLLANLFVKNKEGKLARLLIVATIPAALAGLLFSDFIDDNLRTPLVVAIMLAAAAVVMLVSERFVGKSQKQDVTTKQGLTIGFAQVLALIPGTSRSGITMTAGFFMGLSRQQAARFSFLLAIPVIAGSALGVLLSESDGLLSTGNWQLAIGIITAFVSGLFAIKFMLGIISKVGLKPFAYYRLVLAAAVLMFLV